MVSACVPGNSCSFVCSAVLRVSWIHPHWLSVVAVLGACPFGALNVGSKPFTPLEEAEIWEFLLIIGHCADIEGFDKRVSPFPTRVDVAVFSFTPV